MKLITNEVDERICEQVAALYESAEGLIAPDSVHKEIFANKEGYTYFADKVSPKGTFLSTDPDHDDGLFT